MGVGCQCHALTALPPGKTQYPLYRRLGRPQGWYGQAWKISPPPGFDPRTTHPAHSVAILTELSQPLVIYILPSSTTNSLNLTLHATCFGHPQPPAGTKVHNLKPKWAYFIPEVKRYLRNKISIIIQCYYNCKICEISQIAKHMMYAYLGFKLCTLMPEGGRRQLKWCSKQC